MLRPENPNLIRVAREQHNGRASGGNLGGQRSLERGVVNDGRVVRHVSGRECAPENKWEWQFHHLPMQECNNSRS
jgi:uncharacterized membrane protein